MTPIVKFRRLPHGEGLPLPAYQTAGAAGMDLRAAEAFVLGSNVGSAVATGFAIEIADGYEGQLRPRSGLAFKHGIIVLNSPGTIDSDYRGEVKVLLFNLGDDPVEFSIGDRIAQLVIAPVARAEIVEAETLSETTRGDGGFGSSGT